MILSVPLQKLFREWKADGEGVKPLSSTIQARRQWFWIDYIVRYGDTAALAAAAIRSIHSDQSMVQNAPPRNAPILGIGNHDQRDRHRRPEHAVAVSPGDAAVDD